MRAFVFLSLLVLACAPTRLPVADDPETAVADFTMVNPSFDPIACDWMSFRGGAGTLVVPPATEDDGIVRMGVVRWTSPPSIAVSIDCGMSPVRMVFSWDADPYGEN